jgi:ubiquinone/menaquinone biosynthesis C-methylase UbiE
VVRADALALPYPNGSFDSVLSSYLLDLLPIEAMAGALGEFHRILRPTGRIVLVNLTKATIDGPSWYERCYRALPSVGRAYVLGGCRPVRMAHLVSAAGFVDARRTVVPQLLPSEILIARKQA